MEMKQLIKETIEEMLRNGELELDLKIDRENYKGTKIKISIVKKIYNEDDVWIDTEELTSTEEHL